MNGRHLLRVTQVDLCPLQDQQLADVEVAACGCYMERGRQVVLKQFPLRFPHLPYANKLRKLLWLSVLNLVFIHDEHFEVELSHQFDLVSVEMAYGKELLW